MATRFYAILYTDHLMPDKIPPKLSPREEEVINLAAQGFTDNGIANRMEISATTVNSYWVRIRSKLGSLSRTELVRDYLMAGADEALKAVQDENERLQQQLHSLTGNGFHTLSDSNTWVEIFQKSSDAILVVNTGGRIILSSPSATEMFGHERDDLIGLSVDELVPVDMRAIHDTYRSDYFSKPTSRKMGGHMATPAQKKDGTMFPVAVVLTPLNSEDGVLVCCYMRNISTDLESVRLVLAASESGE